MADDEIPSRKQVSHLGKIALFGTLCVASVAAGVVAVLKLPIGSSWIGLIPAILVVWFVAKRANTSLRLDLDREEEAFSRVRATEALLTASWGKHDLAGQDGHRSNSAAIAEASKSENHLPTLAALLAAFKEKDDLNHKNYTRQANRSYLVSVAAMTVGLLYPIAIGIYAIHTRTAATEIAAATSPIMTAFAGYNSRTFLRSQKMAASDLRAYNDRQHDLYRRLIDLCIAEESAKSGKNSALIGSVEDERVPPK
jgi:fermentation-respiration switch protein FrsA (DUF1100 family)